ncbi:MAG TPA: phage integrase SAM-like domain-containing protein [Salinimicrobium sp.]|nr:phage integrase SAM-like domain-containing protein [Salinimicrobium sp.]
MATINFSYRSSKPAAKIEARLSYSVNKKRKFQQVRINLKVSKDFWHELKEKGDRFRDTDKINERNEINEHLVSLQKYLEDRLPPSHLIDENWLKNSVQEYYNPRVRESIPDDLIGYWNYYMALREHEIKEKPRSWQKWNEVKHRVERFQSALDRQYKIRDVNDEFKRDWVNYCKGESYANTTIKKNLTYIKMVCMHAERKGVETSSELPKLQITFREENIPKVYLSFGDLEKINQLKDLPDYLENARDWLLISCYTGQRVSDFMRFNSSMIRESKRRKFIDITQKKTDKKISIPLLPEVETILNKNGGGFPRFISSQKYNNYIKEIGKRAGLNTPTTGKVLKKITEGKNRKVTEVYPKWQLITSHIGRRSLATNFYGTIPSSYLKNITGHGTEAMLLAYIGKTSKDTAFEAYDLMVTARKNWQNGKDKN